jgi:pimeloyl-ACP methyl ester carboxylesterase
VHTRGHWISSGERPLLAWLSAPEDLGCESGVLILAPIGYPYWSSHRTLRVLSERLAEDGHLALRFDYDSTGDSAGQQWDPDRVAAWRMGARAAAEELRRLGCRRLVVVGVRMGAMFALLDGAQLGADAVVAWAPVTSGRRYVREIRLISTAVPESGLAPDAGQAVVSAGTIFAAQTLAAISKLDVRKIVTAPAARILLLDEAPQAALADQLRGLGSEVQEQQITGGESALESPTEYATVPEEIVQAIRIWVGPGAPGRGELPTGHTSASLRWGDVTLNEQIVELGRDRLIGILTEPEALDTGAATIVFLNSGSEPHIGPGRAWVEYARELAVMGHRCLRVDFRGWGESPDDGHAPGRPYDPHCEEDTVAIVRALRALGHERIVLVGLCASAWIALRAVKTESAAGVIALNPQLYWRVGDPVEATMQETRMRRTAERQREWRGGRYGLWSVLDVIGHRPEAARWLDQLRSAQTPVVLVFAEGDDGIEYLRNRLSRRLRLVQRSGGVRVIEIPEVDHSMHRVWLRPLVVRTLHDQVNLLVAGG